MNNSNMDKPVSKILIADDNPQIRHLLRLVVDQINFDELGA